MLASQSHGFLSQAGRKRVLVEKSKTFGWQFKQDQSGILEEWDISRPSQQTKYIGPCS